MKNIFLLLLFISTTVFSQQFDKKWSEVVANEKLGKIKTANEIVRTIYKKAANKKNEVEIIKCFFYRSKYRQVLEENAQTKIINDLKQQITIVSTPSKAILNLIYTRSLQDYYNDNRYLIQRRTNLVSDNEDFLTWSSIDFENKMKLSIDATLSDETKLKNTPLTDYQAIFDFFTLDKFKNQNLYTYLLKENIQFYTSKISVWDFNQATFETKKNNLLGTTEDFTKLNLDFITNEKLSKTLTYYQKLENTEPTIENILKRLQFCNDYLIKSDQDLLIRLKQIKEKLRQPSEKHLVNLQVALLYAKNASKQTHPDYNVKAITLLDSIITAKDHSNTYKRAIQKKGEIESKSLTVQLQKQLYNKENSRAFISYQNTNNIIISYYKIPNTTFNAFESNYRNRDSLAADIKKNTKLSTTTIYELIDKKDYFEYTTEVLLPQLTTGNYLVSFESKNELKETKGYGYEVITITNLSLLASRNDQVENYTVLDRKTGKPLESVTIKSNHFTITTNANGLATHTKIIDYKRNYENSSLVVSTITDTLSLNNNYLSYQDDYDVEDKANFEGKIEFFLDRAIYRPGQTVYYKGIAYQKKDNQSTVVPKTSFTVTINDPKGAEVKNFDVVTNDFGSFSGEFILPTTGLTGSYTMQADEPNDYEKDVSYNLERDEHPFWDNVDFNYSTINFNVEEYKRPKFEIIIEQIKETVLVNQLIKSSGIANAFSGSTISHAKVAYTIERIVTNPIAYRYGRYEKPEIITTTTTETDANGKFNIEFVALPSLVSKSTEQPVFSYWITANVTDVNGETRTVRKLVAKVGYHALELKATVNSKIETANQNNVTLSSENLNGQFVPTKGQIKLYLINPTVPKFKTRVWQYPDFTTISKTEFDRLFPYEINSDPNSAKEIQPKLLFTKTVDTKTDKTIPLDFIKNYESGSYKIVFSAVDEFKNNVETTTEFQIQQSATKFTPNELFTVKQINKDPKKDGFARLEILSVIDTLHMNIVANYSGKTYYQNSIMSQNHTTSLVIPINKEFENDIKIGFETIFENQLFTKELSVALQTVDSELNFEVETFRNKIEPGKLENWSFKLNANHTTNEAEILASMYDRSLDQFTITDWRTLGFPNYNPNYINTRTALGFDKTYTKLRNLKNKDVLITLYSERTQLMWFGFNFSKIQNKYTLNEYYKQLGRKSKVPFNVKVISGIVSDESGPLAGVYINIKGTDRFTSSDFEGYFQIEAVEDEILVFNYIGYEKKEQTISSNSLDVELKQDNNNLEEVVVIGYATKKNKSLTAAATEIVAEADNQIYNMAGIPEGLASIAPGLKIRGASSINGSPDVLYIIDGVETTAAEATSINPTDILSVEVLKNAKAVALYGNKGKNGVIVFTTKKAIEALTQVKARTNLAETAFFYPTIKTDKNGKFSFSFTSPEALTAWKLRLLTHNKNAVSGYLEKTVITQKELMIVPNFPRFFREKDTITIMAKIANTTKTPKVGLAILQLFDAATMQSVDAKMLNTKATQNFSLSALGNTTSSWKIVIPQGMQGVQYRILAKSGNFSDGEENIVPVLTNSMLVTESIPVWVRENTKKEYSFENLKNNTSTTLRNHQFTLEYTSNPTWLALQSLPYLMEYEHECAEQTFARYYANALATTIINSNPKIAIVFDHWKENGKLKSALETNEELKSIILAETPWLNDAKSEEEKKQKLATLFDLDKMKQSQEATFAKLKQKQQPSGAFSWFDGGGDNEYITRHILSGLGHLEKIQADSISSSKIKAITKTAIPYIDIQFLEQYKRTVSNLKKNDKLVWINPSSELHYLYTRSFYLSKYLLSDTLKKATTTYLNNIEDSWLTYSLYEKGMAALVLHRFGEKITAKKIIENLKETASTNEDWGMYWIANKAGWYWYQAPIETQALLIEAFTEINNDTKSVDAMKVWLLKNKQTKNWPTTKATTEAIYALLLQGSDWLSVKDNTVIKIGDDKILTKKLSTETKEAESGYLKINWKADEIKKEMSSISIDNKSKVPGYGGLYWQYFEELDKIKSNTATSLTVSKELYVKSTTTQGDQLQQITTARSLKLGDLVTVRLIIKATENMEFVHLKDMRASCFEPIDVLSSYEFKSGLGFYKSTRDAATHFFFDQINKGTYVLEYDIRVNNLGDFSNGISTIQSMYAPEFSSHTKGIRVQVKE
ncbi:MAG: carboxypeptidase-like regulatory domain-containing protein [Flavobacteriaceae bacterium]|nr:carboxypeptidase-like regulatory domain-containing protein [Flavobacteriaceae bacterium]